MQNLIKDARHRGVLWLTGRILQEFKTPTKLPGRLYRAASVSLYLALFKTIGVVVKPFLPADDSVTVFYDLNVSPVTFDVVWALAAAEMVRRKSGAQSIHFVLVRGDSDGFRDEAPEYETAVPHDARRQRVENIILKMPKFLPTATKTTVCGSRLAASLLRATRKGPVYPANYWPAFPSAHKPNDVMSWVRSGEPGPLVFRAQDGDLVAFRTWLGDRLGDRKLVTITLRSYSHFPVRNSNVDAWRAFAERLDKSEYFPVFIPDTSTSLKDASSLLGGFPVCMEAAQDIGVRMAVYESAYLNLMVNNGPYGLCMFNEKCRYLMFKMLTPDAPQTTLEYMEFLGFEIGKDPPFARAGQKWIWEDDRLDVIEREFVKMRQAIDRLDGSY